jgi:hypothetical protein
MADFNEFLIVEFNEQHNNMRQIESSMTQMIQGFFSIEGIVLAGALSLLSFNFTANQIVSIMAPIFLVPVFVWTHHLQHHDLLFCEHFDYRFSKHCRPQIFWQKIQQ